ncbi:MAG: PaaI family thioesterase [Betaproteobacteria bacterium]|nr:MAG: PaaI family thioesterase [Betaproteobacteria bacterium]
MTRQLTVAWSDPAALAQAGASMSGLEFLCAIRDGRLPAPPIARLLGFRLVEVGKGLAAFEVVPGEQHYNPIGVVHGGLAMTLLDSAMGCAVQTHMPAGGGYTTLEAKTNLTRPITARTGVLRAIGKAMHVGSRVATAEGRLIDAAGKLYAHATTTCMVLSRG